MLSFEHLQQVWAKFILPGQRWEWSVIHYVMAFGLFMTITCSLTFFRGNNSNEINIFERWLKNNLLSCTTSLMLLPPMLLIGKDLAWRRTSWCLSLALGGCRARGSGRSLAFLLFKVLLHIIQRGRQSCILDDFWLTTMTTGNHWPLRNYLISLNTACETFSIIFVPQATDVWICPDNSCGNIRLIFDKNFMPEQIPVLPGLRRW